MSANGVVFHPRFVLKLTVMERNADPPRRPFPPTVAAREDELVLDMLRPLIGSTPLVQVDRKWLKWEGGSRLTGSIKDRTAFSIFESLVSGGIDATTTLVASSSGGFAVAASVLARRLGLRFVAIIDRLTPPGYRRALAGIAHEVIVCRDLTERLATVDALKSRAATVVMDQYVDRRVLLAHDQLGTELIEQCPGVRALFAAVSTGGTILGIARRVKRYRAEVQVVAVDVEGSKAFYNDQRPRRISGVGANRTLPFLRKAREEGLIDEVIQVSTDDTLQGCADLLAAGLYAGHSSGAVLKAMITKDLDHAVGVLADRGAWYA